MQPRLRQLAHIITIVVAAVLLAVEFHKLVCRRRDLPRATDKDADDPDTSDEA